MFIFRVLLLVFFSVALYAAPSISQIQSAVAANPALLQTPQAQAAMKERGINSEIIKAELQKNKSSDKEIVSSDKTENKLDVLTNSHNNNASVHHISKEANPFKYKTNIQVRKEFLQNQQHLTQKKLSRYSLSFFTNKNSIDLKSLPTPKDYIIASGDIIDVHIYGDRDLHYTLPVNNEGTVDIQYIGPVRVAGIRYADAKKNLIQNLKKHFPRSSFNISIAHYSSIQVTLVGAVKHPGLYNLPSFTTVKDLLIAAKGIQPTASLRDIVIKRDGKTISHLDMYKLFFQGEQIKNSLLRQGDIVVIKNAKKLVSIDGFVNHAAIFELKENETLGKLIEYSGGMKPNASKLNIKVQRYADNKTMKVFNITYEASKHFTTTNGDKIYIYPLDMSSVKSINIYGNIIRPGSYNISKNMNLTQFFKRELSRNGISGFFLPDTYFNYAIIKRYTPALDFKMYSFNLKNIINGKKSLTLHTKDTLYIFSKNDIYANFYVTTQGKELLHPGKLQFYEGMTLQDAVNASGIDGAIDDKVKITTMNTPDKMPQTAFYSLKKDANKLLSPFDNVEVYGYYKVHKLLPVTVKGEVTTPTTVFYENGMTIAKLLEMAGGFTNRAYKKSIELVRYYTDKNNIRRNQALHVSLNNVSRYKLQPYDEITVHTIPNWGKKKTVTLKGEVKFPGVYTIRNGERLADVIKRAGGFTKEAFVEGAVFTREQIKKMQLQEYNNSLAKLKRTLAIYNAMPANAKTAASSMSTTQTLNEIILNSKKYQPIGRISIQLDRDINKLQQSSYNMVLQNNDTLYIPGDIDTVTVFGEVYNPTSFVYNEKYSAEDYIKMSSGLLKTADKDNIYIIHADGSSEPVSMGWLMASQDQIKKGDTIVAPVYIKEMGQLEIWSSVSKILSGFALTVASLHTVGTI